MIALLRAETQAMRISSACHDSAVERRSRRRRRHRKHLRLLRGVLCFFYEIFAEHILSVAATLTTTIGHLGSVESPSFGCLLRHDRL